jgi:hypothetical protein
VTERSVDQERVRQEHLAEVRVPLQWGILVGVIGGGTLLMLALIALLGATAG